MCPSVHLWHPLVLKNRSFFMLKYRCGSFDNSIKSYIYLCGNKQVSHVFSHCCLSSNCPWKLIRENMFWTFVGDHLVFVLDKFLIKQHSGWRRPHSACQSYGTKQNTNHKMSPTYCVWSVQLSCQLPHRHQLFFSVTSLIFCRFVFTGTVSSPLTPVFCFVVVVF